MQRICPLVRHFPILPTKPPCGLIPILAALLIARDRALQSLDLLQAALVMGWMLLDDTVRHGSEALQAQVHAHHWPGVLWHDSLLLHQHGDVPMSGVLAHGG